MLWNGGISFGGVIAFIFADLIILPILNIYRKYYGGKVSLFLLATFYATMAAAGYVIEILFDVLGLTPMGPRHAKVVEASVHLNYTTVLDLVLLVVAAILVIRFLRTGGPAMLRMMDAPMEHAAASNDPDAAHAAHEGSGSATYTCPMHPEVEEREGGTCPKCGMKLVPKA